MAGRSAKYRKLTPLEHVTTRPGMYVGSVVPAESPPQWLADVAEQGVALRLASVGYSMAEWFLVVRRSETKVTPYACAADAVLAWLDYVMTERRGLVFMGKRMDHVFAEVSTLPERSSAQLVVHTEAI